jgi:hydroxyacylglutathione hydrolase
MKQYYIREYTDKLHTKVILIPIFTDNYVYVLTDDSKKCFIVDPGLAYPVCDIVEELGLTPTHLLITHSHPDHIGGVTDVQKRFPKIKKIDFYSCPTDTEFFKWNERPFTVFKTPGHWPDHICFFEESSHILFCGDILFRFGCGRIFDGTFEQLYSSLQKIKTLPNDTQVYCTHEYTQQNLAFCIKQVLVDPSQFSEEERQGVETIPTLPVNLEVELKYNPFLKVATLEGLKRLRILRNGFKNEM